MWSTSPLARYFAATCFSCDIGCEKPELAAYATAVDRLGGIPAASVIYVGDGGSNELEGARAVGFGRVIFMRGFVSRNGLRTVEEVEALMSTADRSIQSIRDLPELIGCGGTGPAGKQS
jgi:FMN phosphatase YigB (HAD superfamily)